jgi:hypothetical protein
MDEKLIQELLDEFIPTLEALEAQSTAAIQFIKDQGKTNEKKLAPYLENAAKASNVKWLAVRLRLGHLISSAVKNAERAEQDKHEQKVPEQKADKKDKENTTEEKKTTEAVAVEEAKDKPKTDAKKQTPENEDPTSNQQENQLESENKTPQSKEAPKSEAA